MIGLWCLCRCSAAFQIPRLLLVCLTHTAPSSLAVTGYQWSNPLSCVSRSCFITSSCVISNVEQCCDRFSIISHCRRCFIPPDWPRVRLSATLLLPPPATSMQHCASICDATQRLFQAADSFQQVCNEFQGLKPNFSDETNYFALAVLVRHGRIGRKCLGSGARITQCC